MKQSLLFSILTVLVLSSCSHHISQRNLSSSFSCTDALKSLWSSKESFSSQKKTLTSLHEDALEISHLFYSRGLVYNNDLSEIESKALLTNLDEMRNVKRGEGVPYASHPIKLANLSRRILGRDSEEARQTYLYTMIHDVLEEGKGTELRSFNHLRETYSNRVDIAEAAYILVEPDIKEIPLPENIKYSMIEVVGYGRQISYFAHQRQDRALVNASLIDKLFNVFDRYKAVADGIVQEDDFEIRMQWRLAKQGYLLEKMGSLAHPDVFNYARSLHENMRTELGFSKSSVDSKIIQYKELEEHYSSQIDAIIEREATIRDLV